MMVMRILQYCWQQAVHGKDREDKFPSRVYSWSREGMFFPLPRWSGCIIMRLLVSGWLRHLGNQGSWLRSAVGKARCLAATVVNRLGEGRARFLSSCLTVSLSSCPLCIRSKMVCILCVLWRTQQSPPPLSECHLERKYLSPLSLIKVYSHIILRI